MQDKNLELMENAPIPKAVLSLALPTVFSSIVILIYNLADTYFIGMLNDKFQLGAVSLAYPIFTVVQNYHLSLDSGLIGIERCVEIIVSLTQQEKC